MAQRIVFLCTGNICRSPLVEVIATERFKDTGWSFASAGLNAVEGLPASVSSQEYALSRGLSLAGHRSQPVSRKLLAEAAWFIGMTRSHAGIFRSRYGAFYAGAIGVLGAAGVDLAGGDPSPAAEEVADPYGLSRAQYFDCGRQIERLVADWAPTFAAGPGKTDP